MLESMRAEDVPAVAAIEAEQHPTPWQASGFDDALRHQWHTAVLRGVLPAVSRDSAIESPGARILGYYVAMSAGDDEELLTLTVCPEVAGRGYGRQLLMALINDARNRGAQKLFLEVRQSNTRAVHLYESAGFTIAGMRKNYYAIPADAVSGRPAGRENALLMQLILQESAS